MEHIEYFKRFAVAYLRYVAYKFDQIVADSLKKHTEGMKRGRYTASSRPLNPRRKGRD